MWRNSINRALCTYPIISKGSVKMQCLGKLFQVLKSIRNLYEIYQQVIVLECFTQVAMSSTIRRARYSYSSIRKKPTKIWVLSGAMASPSRGASSTTSSKGVFSTQSYTQDGPLVKIVDGFKCFCRRAPF